MVPVVSKFRTFREAEEATREYYRSLTPAERLEILFQLRAMAFKEGDSASERLARVYRITQLKRVRRPKLERMAWVPLTERGLTLTVTRADNG